MQVSNIVFMLRRQPKHKALSDSLIIDRTLRRNQELGRLIQEAEQRGSLEQRVLALIPEKFRDAFRLIGIEQGTLQLQCHSAAIATRLRMQQQQLTRQLSQRLQQPIHSLKIAIRPTAGKRKQTQNTLSLSQENAQALLQEAGQTEDKALRAILQRLASHAKD